MNSPKRGSLTGGAETPASQAADIKVVANFSAVKKHSWRGKYKRIFAVGEFGILTRNTNNLEVTNVWKYKDEFADIMATPKTPTEFVITLRKGRKTSTMNFVCEERAEVLTAANRFRDSFCDGGKKGKLSFPVVKSKKWSWTEDRIDVGLSAACECLRQVDMANDNRILSKYYYKDIKEVFFPVDCPGGIVIAYGECGRLHFFLCDRREEIFKKMQEHSRSFIGIELRLRKGEGVGMRYVQENRLGKYSDDESIMSVSEFSVKKITKRHSAPVARIFCLTENSIVERDPLTYSIVTSRPLETIISLNRDEVDVQYFTIEYKSGAVRRYTSTDRDSLLASLLDSVRAKKQKGVSVKMKMTDKGKRMAPPSSFVDEEIESVYLKHLGQYDGSLGLTFPQIVEQFNINISYAGLSFTQTADKMFAENKEKLILAALDALLNYTVDISGLGMKKNEDLSDAESTARQNSKQLAVISLTEQFQAIRRLVANRTGFDAFTTLDGFRDRFGKRVISALKLHNPGAAYAAIDCIAALMQPMHDDYELAQEQDNKSALLTSKQFLQVLVNLFDNHIKADTGALVVSALLDLFMFAICDPYSDTTSNDHFDGLLEIIAKTGSRSLFKLYQHPSLALVKGAGQIMKAIIEEGAPEISAVIQHGALAEGALIKHLHTAIFTTNVDTRSLTHRELSKHLVALWTVDNTEAEDLLKRILPAGLLSYVDCMDPVPEDEVMPQKNLKLPPKIVAKHISVFDHWKTKMGIPRRAHAPTTRKFVLRRRRQNVKSKQNFPLMFYYIKKDHSQADLIWNHYTREELREQLENEYRAYTHDKALSPKKSIAWNFLEFEISYKTLANEIKIGDHYLRLLLEEGASNTLTRIHSPVQFFQDLYHRFLLPSTHSMKMTCLQALAIVYHSCAKEIGPFNDTSHLVTMVERCQSKVERDRLLIFVESLMCDRRNAKLWLDGGGLRILVDLCTLAHLHSDRAPTPMQSNVLEAGDFERASEKEWYYAVAGTENNERCGPISIDEVKELFENKKILSSTRCWAQGMEGWRPLEKVCQLKWTIMIKDQGVLNDTDLAKLCLRMLTIISDYYPSLDIDDSIIRPVPRVKRTLADMVNLPQLVQLFLTFEPMIVERTATLVNGIVVNNPVLPQLYTTGSFLFALMYMGSNVLPIARLLYDCHTKQAQRSNEETSAIVRKSVLAPFLPSAMICFLENYGPEKFAELFLGEFDNPEAIWNTNMRKMMIGRIAVHLTDYTPRLKSNVRAPYQHCPMPKVVYPELERELFCNQYYLRHLCDTQRFPDWEIKNQVDLLRDILEEWGKEVEKKPPTLNRDECLKTLSLPLDTPLSNESLIRRAYFKLAAKYHPDKNPDGHEMFLKISEAYEFLNTLNASDSIVFGPDPRRIDLLLRSQSILFSRYPDILSPYKYAGYPQLLKTIIIETEDENLFGNPTPLLPAASELAYHTVKTSPLNAEEMRREEGIAVLSKAFARVVVVVGSESKANEMATVVSKNLILFFGAASTFDGCRQEIKLQRDVVEEIVRCMYYKELPDLVEACLICLAMFALDNDLQTMLLEAGALYHLVRFLFDYDYTLHESGVESDKSTHKQEIINNHARLAVRALSRMGGYLENELATPENPVVKKCLRALLSANLAKQLANPDPADLLKACNSNEYSPYLIWNNITRVELTAYLEEQATSSVRSGEHDPSLGANFVFTQHQGMLKIEDIFVAVYNEQPDYIINEPAEFAKGLVDYLCGRAYVVVTITEENEKAKEAGGAVQDVEDKEIDEKLVTHAITASEALGNIIKYNQGVAKCTLGNFQKLFSYLKLVTFPQLQTNILQVIQKVAGNKDCVDDIASALVIPRLLLLLEILPHQRLALLSTLNALVANSKIVLECLNCGALIYLLDIFSNSTKGDIRTETANLFAKLAKDKLHGPKVTLSVAKFLPRVFMDAWKDNPEASIVMFDGIHENPELIWTDDVREKVRYSVADVKSLLVEEQKKNINHHFKLPDNFETVYQELEGELIVGGVFIRLFNEQPGWQLRNPREFMLACFEKYLEICKTTTQTMNQTDLDSLNAAVVNLLRTSPNLIDNVASLGYIKQLVGFISSSTNVETQKRCISILHQLAESTACVEVMGAVHIIPAIKSAMEQNLGVVGLAAECLYKIMTKTNQTKPSGLILDEILKQNFIDFLLLTLERPEVMPASKAHIVKAMKEMFTDELYGDQVHEKLTGNPVWAKYKDQRHDLFITNQNTVGCITGPVSQVSGYLTNSAANPNSNEPPPMDDV